MSSDSTLVEVSRLQQSLRSLLRCPICLDLRRSSATTRCGHSFCNSCISDWIKVKGTRGKVKCPACQEDGVTRRSLAKDNYGQIASMVDSLFKAGLEDTNGDIDFLSVRTVHQESRESASSPSQKSRESAVSQSCNNSTETDNTIPIKEANSFVEEVVDVPENGCKVIKPLRKIDEGKLWNKEKTSRRKTYRRGVDKEVSSLEKDANSSPALPGEELSGDEEWNSARRRRDLPCLPVSKNRVNHWLDGGVTEKFSDPDSQPASCSAVSTPGSGLAPIRTFSNIVSPLSTGNHPLTPLDSNKVVRKVGQMKKKLKKQDLLWETLLKKTSPQTSSSPLAVISSREHYSPTLSQVIPNSCPVDVNDTFDKLLPEKPKPKVIAAASPVPSSSIPSVIFDSQMGSLDDSLPQLLSPQTSHNLLRSLDSPGVMEMEENGSDVSAATHADRIKKDSLDSGKELGLSAYLTNTDSDGIGRSNRSRKRVSWQDREEPEKRLQKSHKRSPGWEKAGRALGEMSATSNSKYPCLDTTKEPLDVKKEVPEDIDLESVDSCEPPTGYESVKKNTSDGLENLLMMVSNATETYRNRHGTNDTYQTSAPDIKYTDIKKNINHKKKLNPDNSSDTRKPNADENTFKQYMINNEDNPVEEDKKTSDINLDSFPSELSANSGDHGEDTTLQQLCGNMASEVQHDVGGGNLETEVVNVSGCTSQQQGRRATFSLEVDTQEIDGLSCPQDTLEMVNNITTNSPPFVAGGSKVPNTPRLTETSQKRLSASGFRSLVVFSRMGRTRGQKVAQERERPVAMFLQLGRLSSPCFRGPALPNLRQILARSPHCGESEMGDLDTTPGHRQAVARWVSNLHTPDSHASSVRQSDERLNAHQLLDLDNILAPDKQTSSLALNTTDQVLDKNQTKTLALKGSVCLSVKTGPLPSLATPRKCSSVTMTSRLAENDTTQLLKIVGENTDQEMVCLGDNLEHVVGFDRKDNIDLENSNKIVQPVEVTKSNGYGKETLVSEVPDMETEPIEEMSSIEEKSLVRTDTKSECREKTLLDSLQEQHISMVPNLGQLALSGTRTGVRLSKKGKKALTEENLFINPEPGPSGLQRKATRSNTRNQVRKVESKEVPEEAIVLSSQSSEDSEELPDIERIKSTSSVFMSRILGPEAEHLYSQDRETVSQQQERLARQQFEKESNIISYDETPEENKKRERDLDTQDESPVKTVKKLRKIESDDEESGGIEYVQSPARLGLCNNFGGPNFLNTFSSSSQQEDEEGSPSELIEMVESQTVHYVEKAAGSDVYRECPAVTGQSESTSLLDPREGKRSVTLSRSSSAGSLTSDSEADPQPTQEMLQELATSEERAKQMRSEMERQEEVAASQDFNKVVVLEQNYSASYQSLETEEADIETCAIEETEEVTDMNTDCRTIPESDDDLFSQTPEDLGSRAAAPVKVSCVPPLDTVTEEPPLVRCPDTNNWRLVTSNLSSRGRELIPEFLTSLGCRGLHSRIDETVTHLIVSTSENLEAQRTLKYLQAVTSGLMVVSDLWVEACLKDRTNLGRAEKWEVTDEELGGCNGPWGSRQRRELGRPPLLKGFEVLVKGDLEGLDRDSVEDLLERAGARAVQDQNAFSFTPSVTRLVLVDSVSRMEAKSKEVVRMLRTLRLVTVDKDWLLDTLCAHSLRPIIPGYTLDTLTKEDLVRAGYGHPLVPAQL